MSSNDDDDRPDSDSGRTEDRIVPDRNWVLRPNRGEPTATPQPPVPPPGAPSAPSAPAGPAHLVGASQPRPADPVVPSPAPVPRPAAGTPQPATRPTISAPTASTERPGSLTPAHEAPTEAIPVVPADPSPAVAPPSPSAPAAGPGPVRSWGSQPTAPVAPPLTGAATQRSAAPAGEVVADPPTLTPADSPTAAPPVARSASPTNVTLGPAARNVAAPQGAPAGPARMPQPAPPAQAAPPRPAQPAPARQARGGPNVADLAQQLAATQAQVAALSAQLTTLAHRLTYDVERGAQTTSEKVSRELERTLADAVALRVGAHLGPAVDDLTDQLAEDFGPKVNALVEEVAAAQVGPRLLAITDAIDSLPMGNVEVLGQLDALGTDLQDRFQRFATRLFDQFENLERTNLSELLRLRDHVEELRTSGGSQSHDVETLRRLSTHVERLAQRTPGTAGIVAAVETLITEHLETVRTGLDEQVATLAPTLQVELDAVRAENLTAIGAIEHELLEQLSTIEAGLIERFDGVLADHLDNIDGILAERQGDIVAAVTDASSERVEEAVVALTDIGAARLEEVAAVANLGADRVEELTTAVQELQATMSEGGPAVDGGGSSDAAVRAIEALMSTVVEELLALRKKITDLESSSDDGSMSAAQMDTLAKSIAKHIQSGRAEVVAKAQEPGAHLAKPSRRRSAGKP